MSCVSHVDLEHALDELRREGWTVLRGHLDRESVAAAREQVLALRAARGGRPYPTTRSAAADDPMLWDLHTDLDLLRFVLEDDVIEAVLRNLLNDPWYRQIPAHQPNYILRTFLARSNVRAMDLHLDSFVPSSGDHPLVAQVSIPLDPSTRGNGCTLIVPGSHRSDEWADPSARDRAVPVEAEPGDVVIWDSRVWHGTSDNPTGDSRWALIATFCRWWMKQGFDVVGTVPAKVYGELTPAQRAVLGFCSVPPRSADDRLDMKQGVEDLADDVTVYRR